MDPLLQVHGLDRAFDPADRSRNPGGEIEAFPVDRAAAADHSRHAVVQRKQSRPLAEMTTTGATNVWMVCSAFRHC